MADALDQDTLKKIEQATAEKLASERAKIEAEVKARLEAEYAAKQEAAAKANAEAAMKQKIEELEKQQREMQERLSQQPTSTKRGVIDNTPSVFGTPTPTGNLNKETLKEKIKSGQVDLDAIEQNSYEEFLKATQVKPLSGRKYSSS